MRLGYVGICNLSGSRRPRAQKAQDTLQPNKGRIEVLTKGANLTMDNLLDRWAPGSGSKVIQD